MPMEIGGGDSRHLAIRHTMFLASAQQGHCLALHFSSGIQKPKDQYAKN